MERLEKLKARYWVYLILIFSIPAVWALLVPGFYGASDDIHIAWLYEFHKTLMLGQIPPRFVPDLSFGFGYPLFNFVFPLPFYMGEIFHLLGLSLVESIKAVFLVTVPVSAIFMYLLLRQFTNNILSFIGSLLYIYTPYRATDIYVRGAIGEIVVFMFLPLIFLSIFKLKKSKGLKWIGVGVLSLAPLVLSHNITAYMFAPFVFLLIFLLFFSLSKNSAFLLKLALLVFMALTTSIYFWLPAFLESSLFKYDPVFNFFDHFPTIKQLFTPYWGYGGSVPGEDDGMSFFLGFANILVLVLGAFLLIFKWNKLDIDKKILLASGIFAMVTAFFFMNHRSTFAWNSLPFLPYFQFPWRFLILTTFFVPLFVILFEKVKFGKILYLLLIFLIIFPTWTYFRPEHFLGRDDEYYLNRYIPAPLASEEYLKTREEYLRLPISAEMRPYKNFPALFPEDGIKRVDKLNDLRISFEYELDAGRLISLNKYYFPGWQAKIDGKPRELKAGAPFGQVSIFVPSGSHEVELYYQETGLRSFLNFASLGAFLVSFIMAII